ncbi:hypothetical protein BE221DRAFT_213355 [Ostreococcus tauri]|uniref:ditrans,polycis-polyprenyl diphosphate synthase [(2E,6E)-farnesyldiphosphate specific] n=1 Tax=Ostreococcus tauri TaxID=70448 RepID=A0A1Y5I8J6_OSTTA|nr:hypothetical protein BE221DRAFT_213355 [Ostreococcus tauri]
MRARARTSLALAMVYIALVVRHLVRRSCVAVASWARSIARGARVMSSTSPVGASRAGPGRETRTRADAKPRTAAFVLARDGIGEDARATCERLAEIASWCGAVGIERVSAYESSGRVADGRGRDAMRDALERRARRDGFAYVLRACDRENGGKIDVDALRAEDACAALVAAATRADVESVDDERDEDHEGRAFENKRHVGKIERWMRDRGNFLTPADVVVVFGEVFHLDGYPPWQLYAAEMFHETSLEAFTREKFARIVEKYRTTAQRFGR